MITYRSAVSIGRPAADVWTYLIDPAQQGRWSDVPMRRLDDQPYGEGSRVEVSFGSGLMKATIGLEIVAAEAGRRLAFRSFSGPIRWEGEYRLEDEPAGGTRVSQEGTLTFSGAWRLLEPMAGAEISRGEVKELEKLKAVVEGDSPSG
jgi:uncharacterized protein YndB with AHSA1/START domain